MSLSSDNLVQPVATGSFEAGSGTVSLASPVSGGTTVLICATVGQALGGVAFTGMTGGAGTFDRATRVQNGSGTRNNVAIFVQRRVVAGEQSWTLNLSGSGQVVWAVFELNGVGVSPYEQQWWAGATSDTLALADTLAASKTTALTPLDTTAPTVCYDAMGVQVFGATSADTTVPAVSGYDAAYGEVAQDHHTNGTRSVALGVAFGQIQQVGNFTASAAVSPSAYCATDLVLLYADNAKFVPHYRQMTGFEFGSATGMTAGVVGKTPLDVTAGTPEIDGTFARTGTGALKISTTAAAEYAGWTDTSLGTIRTLPIRLHIYFNGALPAGDAELFSAECSASYANGVKVTYRSASQKIGVKVGSGTEVLSDTAIAHSKHIGLDLGIDYRGEFAGGGGDGVHHYCEWQVDYDSLDGVGAVAQTRADGTLNSVDTVTNAKLGTTQAHTLTCWYDDVVIGRFREHYPVGDHRIERVAVDTGGTCTVNGSAANFKTSTANGGSLATWSSANTLSVLSDMPIVVGASATVLVQATTAASDYVEVPFGTITEAPDKALRAAKVYFAGWKASALAGTIRFRVVDGSGTVLFDPGLFDPPFDNASLRWACGMCGTSNNQFYYALSQSRLDGLKARIGESDDAAPDTGCLGVFLEVAYVPANVWVQSSSENDTFNLYVKDDPISRAVKGVSMATPVGTRGGAFSYTKSGVTTTRSVSANSLFSESVAAEAPGDVTVITMTVDPTP